MSDRIIDLGVNTDPESFGTREISVPRRGASSMSKYWGEHFRNFPSEWTRSPIPPLFNPAIIIHHPSRNYAAGVVAFILLFHLSVARRFFSYFEGASTSRPRRLYGTRILNYVK